MGVSFACRSYLFVCTRPAPFRNRACSWTKKKRGKKKHNEQRLWNSSPSKKCPRIKLKNVRKLVRRNKQKESKKKKARSFSSCSNFCGRCAFAYSAILYKNAAYKLFKLPLTCILYGVGGLVRVYTCVLLHCILYFCAKKKSWKNSIPRL